MIVLLDGGHGGLINGEYQTAGKRSPIWDDGSQLFEGEFNRAIVNRIAEELTELEIPYVRLAPEDRDVSLETRVNRAKEWRNNKCFYLSIHSNAGGGHGSEVFTSVGDTTSDAIATIFGEEFQAEFPTHRLRTDFSDGDLDKEKQLYVLRKTPMPAILFECFFMDHEDECRNILMRPDGRDRIASFMVEAIVRVIDEID